MHYIAQLGDEEQIAIVVNRLKEVVKRKNRQDLIHKETFVETRFDDELSAGVVFLGQFTDERVDRLYDFLRENVELLFDREKSYLAENHADLGIGDGK